VSPSRRSVPFAVKVLPSDEFATGMTCLIVIRRHGRGFYLDDDPSAAAAAAAAAAREIRSEKEREREREREREKLLDEREES